MTKNTFKTILTLSLLGVVLTGCLPKNKVTREDQNKDQTEQKQESLKKEKIRASFVDLLGLGKNMTCTYSNETTGLAGETFISGKKMKTTSISTINGIEMKTNMLSDGTWIYMWTEGTTTGTKMNVEEFRKQTDSTPNTNSNTGTKDYEKYAAQYEYNCEDRISIEESVFEAPSNVNFVDFSQSMKSLIDLKSNTKTNNPACNACELINDETQKTTCKTQLGCK